MEHASPVEAGHGTLGEWPNTPELDSCDDVASICDLPDYYLMDHELMKRSESTDQSFSALFHRDHALTLPS